MMSQQVIHLVFYYCQPKGHSILILIAAFGLIVGVVKGASIRVRLLFKGEIWERLVGY